MSLLCFISANSKDLEYYENSCEVMKQRESISVRIQVRSSELIWTNNYDESRHFPHDLPVHIPITPQMERIMNHANRFNNEDKYIFLPLMESRLSHLDPSTQNNYISNLSYNDKLRAHGWRRIAL